MAAHYLVIILLWSDIQISNTQISNDVIQATLTYR